MKFNDLEEKMKELRGEEWLIGLKQKARSFQVKQVLLGQCYVTREGSLVEVLEVFDDAFLVRFNDGFVRRVSLERVGRWYLYDESFLNRVDSKTRTRFEVKKLREKKKAILNHSQLSKEEKEKMSRLIDELISDCWELQNRFGR